MIRYLHLDVFTDSPLEGNQLAAFPEPGALTTDMMQRITREMNFSECTFIFAAEGKGDVKMRIFTPGQELPMAGHPTIGSTFALALEGTIKAERKEFVFELGVGPISVSLEWDARGLSFAWMTQLRPTYGATFGDRGALAAAAGLTEKDLVPGIPPQVVSCGVPFLFIPLTTRRAVDAALVDRKALARCCRDAGIQEIETFFFTADGAPAAGAAKTVYSRMLAPAFGIAEDPATGGASGPLGCYMLHHGMVSAADARNIVSLQGVAMQRPSRIHISIESEGESVTKVRVGGRSVLIGRGELYL